jgi:hypothetical protein
MNEIRTDKVKVSEEEDLPGRIWLCLECNQQLEYRDGYVWCIHCGWPIEDEGE